MRHRLLWLFGVLLIGGVTAEWLLKPPLYANAHAIGMHTVGLLVPFVGSMTFAVCVGWLGRFGGRDVAAATILFGLLCLPFVDLFAAPIVHLDSDDAYRYSLYAHNIVEHRTLWGSDGLVHDARAYVDQPGYRYWLAATIALLGGEHRGMQLFDMAALLVASLTLLHALETRVERTWFVAVSGFLLASAPYAAKNVLLGNTEWLAVTLFMLFVWHLVRGRDVTAVMLLALVPFVRQNLLLVSLILVGVIAFTTRRWWLIAPHTVVLGLPIYHNLYYAGELRFLVTNLGSTAKPAAGPADGLVAIASVLGSKVLLYLGYHANEEPLTLAIAMVFAPFGSALAAWLIVRTPGWRRWLLVAVAVTAIVPTMILGGAYYPRFVYVNLTVILLTGLAFGDRTTAQLRRTPTASASRSTPASGR